MAPSPPPATEPVSPKPKAQDSESSSTKRAEPSGSEPNLKAEQPLSTDELDRLLSREATALQRDVEVERILKAFKLNPYDLLGLDITCTPAEIKKRYRQLSLFIHPDKATHPRATDAFDLLKKAEAELSDQAKRDELDAVMLEARAQTLKANSLPLGTNDTDSRVLALVPSFKEQIRARARDILIEEEVRRRKAIKMNLANEGLEARRKEEEAATKKRKAEEDARWEENRDHRVDSWRSFNTGKKKKKNKLNVIG
ncbi:unnamed protein product [Rhizoctonia solani]|uniref:J domain-containing protein n=3 Tax=Rhizoctonia solani TaxID=456999 RepID=A0A8H3DGZ7_9AGAM|nr:chaperone protein DnaJ [Rhizoctonia solani AG-3 Rhs1AP]KEP52648.1 chaperone protein DnaJ [Rhizoctonia solani 123E]CAE6515243.1 unnamed protein product [Rhizoctonia solani]CAE6522678.1 unnamed protein product [Rhizoctonia solani]